MGVHYDAVLKMDDLEEILARRGLEPGGKVQRCISSEVIRYCDPKVPFETGALKGSVITASVPEEGLIVYATPYARYLYYGEVYGPNIPIRDGGVVTGFYSPPKKHPTGRALTYNGAPERGAHWFDRAMAEHREDVVRAAAAMAGGKAET